jgi:alpha-amylase/alpha-mannosidase (GH57 family)
MSSHWVCVHGHFYQPARENPWLDAVPPADSAAPYHDWNERVTAECYARNAAARILDDAKRIVRITNTYAGISFDAGPTLLRWLERQAPEVYAAILEADRSSRQAQFGHGNAIAQVYNHVIMPLTSPRDQITQVAWGVKDFVRRFRRQPEGMWLSETAVDVPTLEVLAAQRMAFTILAPHQAWRIRSGSESPWNYVSDGTVDTTIPYRCRLPSGRSITIFFYDAPVSRAIAFEGLLDDGAVLAQRLAAPISDGGARLRAVATDGESYGHHHRFGEMALAVALQRLTDDGAVRLTNFAAYLAMHPATTEVEIRERTSWSCPHGVERWRADCGDRTTPGTQQRWRGPLREAMTWLKQDLDRIYEQRGGNLFKDPWAARDDAVDVIDPEPAGLDAFFGRHALSGPAAEQRHEALRLLEMQRQGMLMQSSDGWFFDDVAGAETVQILTHASRAMDLARPWNDTLEAAFVERLRAAPGNTPAYPDGAVVYDQLVRPQAVPTGRLVAMHAIRSLVEPSVHLNAPAVALHQLDAGRADAGGHALLVGRVRVTSVVTGDEEAAYAVVHFGGHEVHCAVQVGFPADRFAALRAALLQRFGRDVLSEVIRAVDGALGPAYYTLRDLPLEDRRAVLAALTARQLQALEETYRRLYQENRALMEYLREAQAPIPPAMVMAAVVVLTRDLEHALSIPPDQPLSPTTVTLVNELRAWGREVRADRFEPLLRQRLAAVLAGPLPVLQRLQRAAEVLDLAEAAGLTLDLWETQNQFYRLARSVYPQEAASQLRTVGERLQFNMDRLLTGTGLKFA